MPFWRFHTGAGAFGNQLPGVALIVFGRGARACGASTRLAIILALQSNAEAFFLFRQPEHCLRKGMSLRLQK